MKSRPSRRGSPATKCAPVCLLPMSSANTIWPASCAPSVVTHSAYATRKFSCFAAKVELARFSSATAEPPFGAAVANAAVGAVVVSLVGGAYSSQAASRRATAARARGAGTLVIRTISSEGVLRQTLPCDERADEEDGAGRRARQKGALTYVRPCAMTTAGIAHCNFLRAGSSCGRDCPHRALNTVCVLCSPSARICRRVYRFSALARGSRPTRSGRVEAIAR